MQCGGGNLGVRWNKTEGLPGKKRGPKCRIRNHKNHEKNCFGQGWPPSGQRTEKKLFSNLTRHLGRPLVSAELVGGAAGVVAEGGLLENEGNVLH